MEGSCDVERSTRDMKDVKDLYSTFRHIKVVLSSYFSVCVNIKYYDKYKYGKYNQWLQVYYLRRTQSNI